MDHVELLAKTLERLWFARRIEVHNEYIERFVID
jgi:hypothetical protein